MKYRFVLNPAAGKGEGVEALRKEIETRCREAAVDFEVYLTRGVGDAADYVRRTVAEDPASEYRFFACGGDGTLCEAVNGAVGSGRSENVSVGLIPSGTGNDFVRNFLGQERFFDISAQLNAEAAPIDLIRCNDLYAVNMVNVGFDCEVVVKTAGLKKKKLIPSKVAYIAGLVLTLIRKPGVRGRLSRDGGAPEERRYLLNTYANGAFCGGGFHSNPESRLQDGKIDGLWVNNVSRTRFLSIVGKYKKGEHLRPQYRRILSHEKVERVDMVFEKETNISVDGEVVRAKELHLSICPGLLNFLIPKGSELRFGRLGAPKETVGVSV